MPPTDPQTDPGPPSTPAPITAAPTSTAAFVDFFPRGPLAPTPISSVAQLEEHFGPSISHAEAFTPSTEAFRQLTQFFRNGGQHALVQRLEPAPSDTTFAPALRSTLSSLTGSRGLFQLLCAPCTASLPPADMLSVLHQAQILCEQTNAFFLIDPPAAIDTPEEMQAWSSTAGLSASNHSALYFPRLSLAPSPTSASALPVGPCGTVAGIFARIDAADGVWKSPAGTSATLTGASPSLPISDACNSTLNSLAVNCIRSFPNSGSVLWGARTTQGYDTEVSDYKYISVRRLVLFIESSIAAGLSWTVFEPNNVTLWSEVRRSVGNFLSNLFHAGALQGATDDQAWFVRCDSSTMTQADIDSGRLILLIGIAPVKPAEFVIISIDLPAATSS